MATLTVSYSPRGPLTPTCTAFQGTARYTCSTVVVCRRVLGWCILLHPPRSRLVRRFLRQPPYCTAFSALRQAHALACTWYDRPVASATLDIAPGA